jgi:hypothetical protein
VPYQPKPVLAVNRLEVIRLASKADIEITPAWLRDRCPFGIDLLDFTPSMTLLELYRPGEFVGIFADDPYSQGYLWRCGESWPEDLDDEYAHGYQERLVQHPTSGRRNSL